MSWSSPGPPGAARTSPRAGAGGSGMRGGRAQLWADGGILDEARISCASGTRRPPVAGTTRATYRDYVLGATASNTSGAWYVPGGWSVTVLVPNRSVTAASGSGSCVIAAIFAPDHAPYRAWGSTQPTKSHSCCRPLRSRPRRSSRRLHRWLRFRGRRRTCWCRWPSQRYRAHSPRGKPMAFSAACTKSHRPRQWLRRLS